MDDYTATIGLEVHAQLRTKTKMFSNAKNDPEETRPNVNVTPIDLGHPGTLPTINKQAVKHVLIVGLSIGGELADFTEFDRKNYFYPDIPKGYQISQYKYPLVKGGELAGVAITRIHLEEDTARSTHEEGEYSLVDFNRAGTPLLELVTEPVIHSAEQASMFARELQLLLQYLGASGANLEKGEMRIEANISISKTDTFGTKVEVKNLNSFRSVEKAIAYEIERHKELLENGEKIVQETRGWDEVKEVTFSQRAKEDSHDYRYFPDPDLPKLKISEIPEFTVEVLKKDLPELPWEKRKRLTDSFGLPLNTVELYVRSPIWGSYFDAVASECADNDMVTLASNYVSSDLTGLFKGVSDETLRSELPDAKQFVELITMVKGGELSSRGAKDLLPLMIQEKGVSPKKLAETHGLLQKSDEGELLEIAKKIVSEHATVADEVRSGKESALQFLVGQGMKATKGSANPAMLQKIFREVLGK